MDTTEQIDKHIEPEYDKCIFSKLQHSVTTAEAQITNLSFMEDELIEVLIPENDIILIGCNKMEWKQSDFGKSPLMVADESERIKRGRRKVLTKPKRNNKGNYFNSQITFKVKGDKDDPYQIKIFRNGRVQVPGVRNIDMSDAVHAINKICEYLSKVLVSDIRINYIKSVMSNYKFVRLLNPIDDNVKITPNLLKPIPLRNLKIVLDCYRANNTNIEQIIWNEESNDQGLKIKLISLPNITPSENHNDKITTIKIFSSGKINIDGALAYDTAYKIYNWLLDIFNTNIKQIDMEENPYDISDLSSLGDYTDSSDDLECE